MNYLKKNLEYPEKIFCYMYLIIHQIKNIAIYAEKVIKRLESLVNDMSNGKGWTIYEPKYSDFNLNLETFVYIEMSEDWEKFILVGF